MGANTSSNSGKDPKYSREERVEVISKRTIGKLIVKHCGNEGQADDPTLVVSLRRILQATITKLDTESEETWRNAEIVIYDQLGNDFCIRSGDFKNKFVVQLDEKDEINITCTHRKGPSLFSYLRCALAPRSKENVAANENFDRQQTLMLTNDESTGREVEKVDHDAS